MHWWTSSLTEKSAELLKLVRESLLSRGFDEKKILAVALGGLMIAESEPREFKLLLHARIQALKQLVEKKGRDYNGGDISILDYWLFGGSSIAHEIHKRALRLLSIGRSGREPQFESVGEIGLDIAAYSLFLLAYLEVERSS